MFRNTHAGAKVDCRCSSFHAVSLCVDVLAWHTASRIMTKTEDAAIGQGGGSKCVLCVRCLGKGYYCQMKSLVIRAKREYQGALLARPQGRKSQALSVKPPT